MMMIKLLLFLVFISNISLKPINYDDQIVQLYHTGPFDFIGKEVKAAVEGPYVEIKYTYTYKNQKDYLVQAEFRFPQAENDISQKVEIRHENQDIARLVFDEINTPGREYTKKTSDTKEGFLDKRISVGNVKAHEIVQIIFTVLKPLKINFNQFYEISLKAFDIPRSPHSLSKDIFREAQMKWNVQIELKAEKPFAILANPTHQIQPELSNHTDRLSETKIYKAFYNATVHTMEYFTVYFAAASFHVPQAIMATHPFNPHDHAFMFSLIPDMSYFPFSYWDKKAYFMDDVVQPILSNLSDPDSFSNLKRATIQSDLHYFPNEYLFVIDQSDSMKGPRFENLKKTLNTLLENLSKIASFYSILSFGNSSQLHWKRAEDDGPYKTPQNTTEIMKWVESLEANMGEKDLLAALQFAFEEYEWTSLPRNVIILTDGEVANADEIIKLIQKNSKSHKICARGVDEDEDEDIIRRIGEAGGCQIEFAPWWSQHFDDKFLNIMEATLTPPDFNLVYEIKCLDEPGFAVYQEEGSFDGLPKDKAFIKWVTLNSIPNLRSCKAKIFYYSQHRCSSFSEEIEIFRSRKAEVTDVWHRVAQHAKLHKEFLSEESKRKLMVNQNQSLQDFKELFEPQEITPEEITSNDESHHKLSQYDTYQERFYNLKCYDPKRILLTGVGLSKSSFEGDGKESFSLKHEEREEEGIFSLKIISIVSVCTLLFVAGLFIMFK